MGVGIVPARLGGVVMQPRKTFEPPLGETVQYKLPFPPRPGIRQDVCPRCHSLHLNAAERMACVQANAQREQN